MPRCLNDPKLFLLFVLGHQFLFFFLSKRCYGYQWNMSSFKHCNTNHNINWKGMNVRLKFVFNAQRKKRSYFCLHVFGFTTFGFTVSVFCSNWFFIKWSKLFFVIPLPLFIPLPQPISFILSSLPPPLISSSSTPAGRYNFHQVRPCSK